MATTFSVSPKSNHHAEPTYTHHLPASMHCDCSASPRSPGAMDVEPGHPKISSPGALQIQLEDKYLLEKIPSPIRVKPDAKTASDPASPELSPPPSPKRKREVDFSKDLKEVAFTAVLPAKNVDLTRSQSTF